MAEIALISSRKARMKRLADGGNRGAALALRLTENPERFLSTVQVGITLVSVLNGAFGGATLAPFVAPFFEGILFLAPYADRIAFAIVVVFITYASIVIGELVPKGLALRHPETIASFMARPMGVLSSLYLMAYLPLRTWERLLIWLAIGMVVYFAYGVRHSRLARGDQPAG